MTKTSVKNHVRAFRAKGSAVAKQMDRRELQRAFWLFAVAAFSIVSLVLFASTKSHAKSSKVSRNIASTVSGRTVATEALMEPCKDGLNLTVKYEAVQSYSGSSPMTLQLNFQKDGKNRARNITRNLEKDVSPGLCKAWQKHAWPHVDRMIAQSKLKSRGSFECINVAELSYTLGGKRKKSSRICIGNSKQDAMSNAFYQFLDQTSFLAKQR